MALFRIRTVLEELEARLRPPASAGRSTAVGKSERKRYGDHEERLKVRAHRLPVADGTVVEVVISGTVVAELTAQRGDVRLDFSSKERQVPAVSKGDSVELRVGGQPLLAGSYGPD